MKSVKLFLLAGLFLFLGINTVQAAPPSVTGITVTSSPLGGGGTLYDSGEAVRFQVTFAGTAGVTGGGNPRLVIEVAGNDYFANYVSGSGTATWLFDMLVGPGMNDGNGVAAKSFELSLGGITDSGSGNPLVLGDFPDVNISGVHVDNDSPTITSYNITSTDGNLVGGTRYLKAGDQFVGVVSLTNPDTRGATSIDFTIGGGPQSLLFSGTAISGTGNIYQRTSDTNFLNGLNGPLLITTLNYTDFAGKSPLSIPAAVNPNITIDTTLPAISFTDDVGTTEVSSETIDVTVTDTNAPTPNQHEYGFSTDAICDGTDTYGNAFTSGTPFNITDNAQDGKYVCIKATDLAGNISYLASSNPLNLDSTPPAIQSVTQVSSNATNSWAKAGDTITYNITFTESVTVTTVNTASSATNASTLTTEIDASGSSTDTLVFTVQNGDNGEIIPTVNFDIQDGAGNNATINSLGTITGGGYDSKIIADTAVPTITAATINSNNTNTSWAKTGDTITLSFIASEPVQNPQTSVSILGKSATVLPGCGDTACDSFMASITTDGSETEGIVPFSIDFEDRAGNTGVQVTTVTDGSSVRFDKTAPTVPVVSIASNNALDTTLAKTNDTVTVTLSIADNLSTAVSLFDASILSQATTGNTVTATGAGATISRFTDGTETSEVVVPFSIQISDTAGNVSSAVTTTTDGSSVRFDRTDPVTQNIQLSATSIDSSAYTGDIPTYYVKQGDTIKLSLDICDYVDSQNNPPSGTLFGQAVTMTDQGLIGAPGNCTTGAGNLSQWRNWTAQLINIDGTEGTIAFDVTARDNAGNAVVNVTGTTDGSSIIFDKTAPTNPTDVVDLGGLANAFYKSINQAQYSWTNDTDPAGGTPVSGVQNFNIRYNNTNTGINEMVTINAPTRSFIPTTVIPDTAPYNLFMSVVDKAGNKNTEATTYTQKYGITINGTITEKDAGKPLENAVVTAISEFGNECQPGMETCSVTSDNTGYYEGVVAPHQDYIIDFIKTPNHYMAKEEVSVTVNPVNMNVELELVTYPEIQTNQQVISITTDRVMNAGSGNSAITTEIFVESTSGQVDAQQVGDVIVITSFGRIASVTSNNPDAVIVMTGPNTYEVSGIGQLDKIFDAGTHSGNVTTSFTSGESRGGAGYLIGGPSGTLFNGIKRSDRVTDVMGMSYRESLVQAQSLNQGAPYQVRQYVNRNGYVVFGGYRSGTLGLDRFKRFNARDYVVFRGQKTSRGQFNEFNQQNMSSQKVAVQNLFKNEGQDTEIIKDGDNIIIVRAAEERVSTVKGQSVKNMAGYGRKVDQIETEKSRREYEKYDFNPYAREPKIDLTPTSRIRQKNLGNIYLRLGNKKVALDKIYDQSNDKNLIARQ